jgi:hypothetical protein
MKLNPPASSSDLEIAREIARRLHQTRRRADLPRPRAVATTVAPAPAPAPDTKASPPAPVEPSGMPAPAPFPEPPPLPPAIEIEEDQPPSWDVQVETSEAEDAGDVNALSADEILGDHDGSPLDDVADGPSAEAPAEPPPFDIEEDAVPEPPPPMVPDEAPLDASPFDEVDVDAPEPAAPEAGPEDLLDAAPSPPSWDEIIHSCLAQSQARGAMLVGPAGQAFAVEGEWPRPGAEAIAAKLVAMLDRTLRDAPTRSVSAPLAGLHLTAWRVPLAEGLVTVAFIAEAPLRAELRPAIDAEIGRGGGV